MKAPSQPPRELIPTGTHKARCYTVCDLGTTKVTYPGSEPKDVHKIMLTWELPEVRMQFEDKDTKEKIDKPRVISQEYTFSTFKKSNLSVHVTSWMGKCGDDFDFESLLMEPCLLTIAHGVSKSSGNEYDTVASVSAVMTGMEVPVLENDVIYYYIVDHGKDLPQAITGNPRLKWLADKIAECNEWKRMNHAGQAMGISQEQQQAHDEAAPPLEDTTDYGQQDNTVHDDNPDNLPQGTVDGDDQLCTYCHNTPCTCNIPF